MRVLDIERHPQLYINRERQHQQQGEEARLDFYTKLDFYYYSPRDKSDNYNIFVIKPPFSNAIFERNNNSNTKTSNNNNNYIDQARPQHHTVN